MTNRLLLAWLLLLASRTALGQEVVDLPESGYRLTIPAVGWDHVEQRDASGLTTIAVGPRRRGGLVQFSVKPTAVSASGPDAVQAHIDQLVAAISVDESISRVKPFQLDVADRPALGLEVDQFAMQTDFRVRLVFLRFRGIQYHIQFHAPRDEFEAEWATALRLLDGFELVNLGADATERRRLQHLAARCGSGVDWAQDWNEAARRARAEGRLVVVAIQALGGFSVGNLLNERVFTDKDVLALMRHRFVGWHWRAGMPAPFVGHDVFGLSGTTFGTGLLICTPAGDVVRQVYIPEAELAADALRAVLRDCPDLAPPPVYAPRAGRAAAEGTNGADDAAHVAFLLDSGQLDAARAMLDARPRAATRDDLAFQRARLHVIERSGAAALQALEACETNAASALLEARVHLGMGAKEDAAQDLTRCLSLGPDDTQRAKVALLRGVLAWADDDLDAARTIWTDLTFDHADQPSAWVAAATLVGPILELGLRPEVRWPTEAEARLSRLPQAAPSLTLDAIQALHAALDWLCASQRPDGAWDSVRTYGASYPAPDPVTLASHAIAITALMRGADAVDDPDRAARCQAAARKGLDRYLEHRELARTFPRPTAFMDYTCWGSAYGLFALCELQRSDSLDETEAQIVQAEAERMIDELVRIQQANGGWSYYLAQSVGADAAVVAMSFTTATVLLALDTARGYGFEVPLDVLKRGSACLAAMRGPNGNFEYMRMGANLQPASVVAPAGAAARRPVCTLALQRTGQLDDDALAQSFATYVEHLPAYGHESRKALMHAGPAGQGSHYLIYDYSTAAHALAATKVDPRTRATVRAAILRELARCRSANGSFIDNPLIGPVAGTGLAITTLLDLD